MLTNEAMIVKLSISQWTARKYDRKVTRRVDEEYGSHDAGRYNKVLVAKDAIKAVTQAVSKTRAFHYDNTLAWDDNGGRLLPVANYEAYRKGMRELKDEFEAAVKEFVENYPAYRAEAEQRLNGMFDPADYPGVQDIKRRYGFRVDIEPVPEGKDFRVTLQAKDAQRIQKEIDARVKDREAEAMKDLFLRLHRVVEHFAEKLSDPEAIFRDSLVENVVELVALLPKLNVADDKELKKLTAEAKKSICAHSPDVLRSEPKVREQAANDAKAILDKMAAYTEV